MPARAARAVRVAWAAQVALAVKVALAVGVALTQRAVPAALRTRSALAVLLIAASGAVAAADAPPDAPASSGAAALQPCRVDGIRHAVQCGVVRRPLDPQRAAGPGLDIHYVVVPALARRKRADPVFLLAGGPGQSAIGAAGQVLPLLRRLNNRRDLVFVDQRGTGRSAPLMCDEARRETLAEQAEPARQFERLMQCKAELAALPALGGEAGLGYFTTTVAMQDLDAVRRALGAEQINLVGISYGTRAALEYMRQFPAAVRRSVLDAVVPPDMSMPASFSTDNQAALDAVFAGCAAEAACAQAHPELRAAWRGLLRGLPRPIEAAHALSGEPQRFTLTRTIALAAVRGALYSPTTAAALPSAIAAAAAGRYEPLIGLASLLSAQKGVRLATGMHFSVVCAEDLPALERAVDRPGEDFGTEQADLYRRVCAAWPRGAVPAAFYRIPPSRTPTLLLSGGLDPATPPRHGERVAQALGPAAQHVVVPYAGHGALAVGCMHDVLFRFIETDDDAAASAVDASCVKAIPRPTAFAPIRLDPNAAR